MKLVLSSIAIVVLSLMVGSRSGGQTKGGGTFGDAPSWYDSVPKGCGVGSAKHRGLKDMTRKAAVASAREELAGQIEATTQGMMKTFQQQGETEGEGFAEDLQTRVSREIVDQTMVGTRVTATELIDSEFYAMVCLDPETFADAFDRMKDLSTKQRDALRKRAKAEFKDLDAQISKIRKGR